MKNSSGCGRGGVKSHSLSYLCETYYWDALIGLREKSEILHHKIDMRSIYYFSWTQNKTEDRQKDSNTNSVWGYHKPKHIFRTIKVFPLKSFSTQELVLCSLLKRFSISAALVNAMVM